MAGAPRAWRRMYGYAARQLACCLGRACYRDSVPLGDDVESAERSWHRCSLGLSGLAQQRQKLSYLHLSSAAPHDRQKVRSGFPPCISCVDFPLGRLRETVPACSSGRPHELGGELEARLGHSELPTPLARHPAVGAGGLGLGGRASLSRGSPVRPPTTLASAMCRRSPWACRECLVWTRWLFGRWELRARVLYTRRQLQPCRATRADSAERIHVRGACSCKASATEPPGEEM